MTMQGKIWPYMRVFVLGLIGYLILWGPSFWYITALVLCLLAGAIDFVTSNPRGQRNLLGRNEVWPYAPFLTLVAIVGGLTDGWNVWHLVAIAFSISVSVLDFVWSRRSKRPQPKSL